MRENDWSASARGPMPESDLRRSWPQQVRMVGVLLAFLSLAGCFGRVDFVEYRSPSGTHCDPVTNTCGVMKGESVTFEVNGVDTCTLAQLDFGDGSSPVQQYHDFGKQYSQPWVVTHTYTGWPGPKTVKAVGVTNCGGTATRSLQVFDVGTTNLYREFIDVAFRQPSPAVCTPLTTFPPLRANTVVTVESPASSPNSRIGFGCIGCFFDANGEANTSAPPAFPFPGFRKYSLVLCVGAQCIQGGTTTTFRTTQAGLLEICVNDDNLPDNTGAWELVISVDESQAH